MGPGFVKVGAEAGRREGGGSSKQKARDAAFHLDRKERASRQSSSEPTL